ncbi:MAG TPA: polysaccharide deacetylase family protein [Blastocatellia bacterium]|nr:polysaccharide deacetylase family protein [Blastocatellia bacterium]
MQDRADSLLNRATSRAVAEADGRARAARPPLAALLGSLVKNAIFAFYLYCGYVQLRDAVLSLLGRSRAVVLYYHRIGESDVLTKPPDEFRRDLEYLKKNYDCVSFSELCGRLRSGAPARRRSVVITFDDGYRDNFTEAVPVLREAGVTATFFVATGFIDTRREFPHDLKEGREKARFPKLSWDDLRAMEAEGFEIGSHTVNHANLGKADDKTVEREVNESLAALNNHLGARARCFSFPWGKPSDISERAVEAVRRAGYYASASAYGGANGRGSDLFNIRRVDVGNGALRGLALRARAAGLDPDYFRLKMRDRKV